MTNFRHRVIWALIGHYGFVIRHCPLGRLFFPDFIVELNVSGDYIRHGIIFALGSGDLDFAHFEAVAVNIQVMVPWRHWTGGKSDDHKTSFGIDHGHLARRAQIGIDDGFGRLAPGGRGGIGRRLVMNATGQQQGRA